MSEREGPITPSAEPSSPVVVTEMSPAAVETLVAAAAASAVAGPLALSPAATDAIVAAAVASTPPKVAATVAEEVERGLMTAGQRKVSLWWEAVRAIIAVLFTLATLSVTAYLSVRGNDTQGLAALVFLTTSCSAVLHSYLTAVNHVKVGGVGDKTERDR